VILITLPDLPPSVNHSLAVRRRGSVTRLGKSDEYLAWIRKGAWHVQAQRKGQCLSGPVEFRFTAKRPCAASDLDNRLKPIIDACQQGGAIGNDNQIVRIVAEWDDAIDAPTVILQPIAGLQPGREAA